MDFSIRKRLFFISLLTTSCSFLLILLCFNLICSSHIEKTSVKELRYAISVAQKPSAISNGAVTVSPYTFNKSAEDDVTFSYYSENMGVGMVLVSEAAAEYSDSADLLPKGEMATLRSFVIKNDVEAPTRMTLDDSSYYLATAPVGESTAIFYKNVKPLEELASDVNAALFVLLLVCAIATVSVTMGLSNGMIRSIQGLCSFAAHIGSGDFQAGNIHPKERELAHLAEDMNEMAARLSEYDAEQKALFQNASHELRTPLMSIQGYAEGITSGVFQEEGSMEAAEIILAESERLTSLVDDLLCISRMDAGMEREAYVQFDIAEVLKTAAAQALPLADSKGVQLSLEITPVDGGGSFLLMGSQKELQRAILNVLSNGIRYAGSTVTAVVDKNQRSIRISDDGAGIAPEDLPYIFKRFYKGRGGCTGLGLAIAQGVTEKLGGVLTAENGPESGAVFTFRFGPYA